MDTVIQIAAFIMLLIYVLALIYITLFSLMQFHLLYYYKKKTKGSSTNDRVLDLDMDEIPYVTIQLPVYNEKYVIERLIDSIASMDYPKDKLEIQILDDSNDETVALAQKKTAEYRALGFDIVHVRRSDRKGFKAGALKEGLKTAKGEFIAIFDADFLPNVDFLKRTIPYFSDKEIGVVQTKWEHINQDYSLITQLQAFQLNVHFTVEQTGRYKGNLLLQFNGTAGVWRRKTIEDAGGWEADTLTEDLDLSYRSQLAGYKIKFLENVGSPAELPVEMNGLKSQQFRWMKGGAETARKMLPTIWKSNLNPLRKLHATVHLLSSAIFVIIFIVGLFSVPTLFAVRYLGVTTMYLSYFLISMLCIVVIYYVANVQASWPKGNPLRSIFKFVVLFPIFLSLSMGLSFHNAIAVIQGYIGKKSPFVRTPKFAIEKTEDKVTKKSYLAQNLNITVIIEGLLALYFLFGIGAGFYLRDLSFVIFHLLLMLGYGTISYYTIKHLSYK